MCYQVWISKKGRKILKSMNLVLLKRRKKKPMTLVMLISIKKLKE